MEQLTPFPIELGKRIHWRISPKSGNSYDHSGGIQIQLGTEFLGSWSPECMSYLDGSLPPLTTCVVGKGPALEFFYTPKREHFGQHILMVFYPNSRAIFARTGQILLNTTVQVTRSTL